MIICKGMPMFQYSNCPLLACWIPTVWWHDCGWTGHYESGIRKWKPSAC